MTSIDRTIYRHVKRSYTIKELIEAYTPTQEERYFVETMTRSEQQRFNLMLWIKLFPCLGYFPGVDEIPSAIVIHVRKDLSLPEELVPTYDNPRTFYRHHQTVREYYQQGVTVSLTERMNNATTLSVQRSVKGIRRRLGALFFLLP